MKELKETKIHRRYPERDWDYRAISMRVDDEGKAKNVIFYKLKNEGKETKGVEIYSGRNYIVGSRDESYSRRYNLKDLPKKYNKVVMRAMMVHNKTNWSNAERVDSN